jgi:type II secretory pathway pseudopilin PulG
MPTEPERDIEKTLRAYAKKRQEESGAPAELHPATRRLLQGEVARLRGGKTTESASFWAQWFGASWPRFAVSASALVILVTVMAALLLPALSRSKRKANLAMAQYRLKDSESLQDNRKLVLESPHSASADIPDQSKVREGLDGNRVAGEMQTYSASTAPALTSPEGQKKQDLDKNISLTAKSAPPTRDRAIMQIESLDTGLAKRAVPELAPATPPATVAAAAPEPASSTASATIPNSRLALELEESNSSRAPAPAPAAPPVIATTPAALPPASFAFNDTLANHALSEAPAGAFSDSASSVGKPSQSATDSLGLATITTESRKRSAPTVVPMNNFWSQPFARANSTNKLSRRQRTIGRTVLRSFRVEQNGNQIRFIDSDGSVYSGFLAGVQNKDEQTEALTITPSAADVGGRFESKITNSTSLDEGKQGIQNLYFRVSGTNRSLRQPVVFTGNFVPAAAIGRAYKSNLSNGPVVNGSVAPAFGPLNWQFLNSQLQGKVLVGGSNQMDIRALPVNH